jgi:tRNA A37 threonylcarbamoyladenosine synthetase subunit TsaC/SUA5/YrdC
MTSKKKIDKILNKKNKQADKPILVSKEELKNIKEYYDKVLESSKNHKNES